MLLNGCRPATDPTQALLDGLVEAAEARDTARFVAFLAAGFEGPRRMRRAETEAALRRYFAAYESIAVHVFDVETSRDEEAVHVRCRVELSGNARRTLGLEGFLPPGGLYRFELELLPDQGALRVARASWQPEELPIPVP